MAWTVAKRVTGSKLSAVAFGAGVFVAVGSTGTILTSPDGLRWTRRESGIPHDLTAILRDHGQFVVTSKAPSDQSRQAEGILLTSRDGSSWSRHRCPPGADPLNAIAEGGGRLVAVGGTGYGKGKVLVSPVGASAPPEPDDSASGDQVMGLLDSGAYTGFRLVRVTTSGAITQSGPIVPADADRRDFPTVRTRAEKVEDFVPAGWTLESSATGDVDRDGLDDVAFVVREAAASILAYPAHGSSLGPLHRRMLGFALRDAGAQAFHLILQDTSLWPPTPDPPQGTQPSLTIANGSVLLRFEEGLQYGRDFGSEYVGLSAVYRFRYQDRVFRLIGAELDAAARLAGPLGHLSVNLLTGKRIRTTPELPPVIGDGQARGKRKQDSRTETFPKSAALPALGASLVWKWYDGLPEPDLDAFEPHFFAQRW